MAGPAWVVDATMPVEGRDEPKSGLALIRAADAADAAAWARQLVGAAAGAPALTVRTTTLSTYPTTAKRFFAVVATAITGAEVEGTAGTITPAGGKFLALNLGTAVPPVGTNVVAVFIPHRWVFRYDG